MIISLEGLLGAGKTTTAKLVAKRMGIRYIHERSEDVPFLDAFYSNVERYKLETELCFVLIHYHQYRDLSVDTVLDYSPSKDLIFANLNLSGPDLDLFTAVYSHTLGKLSAPDITVFLDLDQDLLLQRIEARGRPYEQGFDPDYLGRLAEMYKKNFANLGKKVGRVSVSASQGPDDVAEEVLSVIDKLE